MQIFLLPPKTDGLQSSPPNDIYINIVAVSTSSTITGSITASNHTNDDSVSNKLTPPQNKNPSGRLLFRHKRIGGEGKHCKCKEVIGTNKMTRTMMKRIVQLNNIME